MACELRDPTEEEQLALRVNWLTPPMEELTPQSIWRSKTVLGRYQLQMPGQVDPAVPEEEQLVPQSGVEPKYGKGERSNSEWKELLAFPSDEVMEKTLESTTQMQVEPVKSERREIPKQHRRRGF